MFTTCNLTLRYGGPAVVQEVDLALIPGQITTLLGPNGCGKSTLLRGLARLHPSPKGSILLEGEALHRLSARDLAQKVGVLAQHGEVPDGLRVIDLVRQGRFPHRGPWVAPSADDEAAVGRALARCDLAALADQRVDELSGGQRQRVWIALTLAQETPVVLLDEPTTYLDPHHQTEVLDLLVALNRELGTTFVLVLHDLDQARRVSHRVVALRAGRILADGSPDQVLTGSVLERLYDVPFDRRGPVPGFDLDRPPCFGQTPPLEARGLVVGYGNRAVLGPVDLTLGPGGMTVLVGPNGCGKSTLLRTLAGLQSPLAGQVWLGDQSLAELRPRPLARLRSFVQQDNPLPVGFTVAELLRLGAYSRRGLWWKTSEEAPAINAALDALDLGALEHRPLEHLSGGQRQRVWLALSLVQHTGLVLLDEPTSFLDPRHQRDLLDALWSLTRQTPTTVVAILHEPRLAARYADRIVDLGDRALFPTPSGW